MSNKKIEIKEIKFKRTNVAMELINIIDLEKQKIIDYSHDCIKVTDVEATRLIAKKYLESGLDKESIKL
jgi:hypothetical protein